MNAAPTTRPVGLPLIGLLVGLGGCGSSTEPDRGTPVNCDSIPVVALAPGQGTVVPASGGEACLRLPPAGGAQEYLVVAYSANGTEFAGGVSGSFSLYAGRDSFASPSNQPVPLRATPSPAAFHDRLRRREYDLSLQASPASAREPRAFTSPITPGSQRLFTVCADLDCLGFDTVFATARYVGTHGVVFLDDDVPAGGYSAAEIDSVGRLFDQWLHPIDTTAFGRESDLDGNGQVLVLLTDQLNRLSGACNTTGQVVVGYFYGLDLLDLPGSNRAEVFYGFVPDPGNPVCTIDRSFALRHLAPVFVHEFQHMISFNRHVLLAGERAEEVWLNEGLSHFAEELAGRQITGAWCRNGNCLDQFARENVTRAYEFLRAPHRYFLVEPGISVGTLPERGANWLFVRWLAEQSPGDSLLGTTMTRRLSGADLPGGIALTGEANVAAAAQAVVEPGWPFARLLAEWHVANYAEWRADAPIPAGRLRYRSWNLPAAFDQLILGPWPLVPDSTRLSYRIDGTLLGGSGRLLRVLPGSQPVALTLVADRASVVLPHLAAFRLR
jgi:hypothetical protein